MSLRDLRLSGNTVNGNMEETKTKNDAQLSSTQRLERRGRMLDRTAWCGGKGTERVTTQKVSKRRLGEGRN